MKPGEIIFDEMKDGPHVVIRYLSRDDVVSTTEYLNAIFDERTTVGGQGKVLEVVDQQKRNEAFVCEIEDEKSCHLLLVIDDVLSGYGNVTGGKEFSAAAHVASLGFTIKKEGRGHGFGTLLMKHLLGETQKLKDVEIVLLSCFSSNEAGFKLYKNAGFVEYGRLPNGFVRNGEYDDEVLMYKKIK